MDPLITAPELLDLWGTADQPVVLDARWYLADESQGAREYAVEHVPGSLFIDVAQVASGPQRTDGAGGRHPLPSPVALQEHLRTLGLNLDTPVVVLDQGPSLGAARVWWVLRDAGLTHVRVLDGGFAAWVAAGGPVTAEPTSLPQPSTIEVTPGQLPVVAAPEVQAALAAGQTVVDVRASERFEGRTEPIDAVAGHIPGARNIPAATLQNPDGTFLPAEAIQARLADLEPGDVFSCGSGITAAQALLAAESAGITGLRIYPGSWSDWISDPSRPVATGA